MSARTPKAFVPRKLSSITGLPSAHRPKRTAGTTLIELVIVLAIVAILADFGTREWAEAYQRHQSNQVTRNILSAIHTARTSAILQHQWATLCPSRDGTSCTADWGNGILVFLDFDRDGAMGEGDRSVYRYQPIPEGGSLRWRSFRNKPYLQMIPTGRTNQQNGSFVYCPGDHRALRHARVIIVNKLGHSRSGGDQDGDGIREMASGAPIQCEAK